MEALENFQLNSLFVSGFWKKIIAGVIMGTMGAIV
jgi:hypothetical protein